MPIEALPIGSQMPALTGKDQNGNTISLSDFKGKKVALYFYPEDDTPGCTLEACNLRDNYALLQQKGIVVLGVSADDAEKHRAFIDKFSLPFPLIADTDRVWIDACGAWGQKNMYGKVYEGIHRITYLIDENGKIFHVFKKVKTESHSEEILKKWGLA